VNVSGDSLVLRAGQGRTGVAWTDVRALWSRHRGSLPYGLIGLGLGLSTSAAAPRPDTSPSSTGEILATSAVGGLLGAGLGYFVVRWHKLYPGPAPRGKPYGFGSP